MPAAYMQASKPVAPPVRYIHTRLLRYHPCVVDLRWSRAVHSCDVCPYRNVAGPVVPGRAGPVVRCGAVHYGICSAVKAAAAGVDVAVSPVNGRPEARSASPPPPPLPTKRRINIPIIVQKQQQVRVISTTTAPQQWRSTSRNHTGSRRADPEGVARDANGGAVGAEVERRRRESSRVRSTQPSTLRGTVK